MTAKVLVTGGRGYFGRRVVVALRAAGLDVVCAGRRARPAVVALDVARPEPGQLRLYDAVVNCVDTLAVPAGPFHRAALAAGTMLLETTAEPGSIEAALALRCGLQGPGTIVLGLGIFPGLSNLLTRAAFEDNGRRGPVEVGMRFSPFSGAGAGMIALIAHLMAEPAPYYRDGERLTVGAFSRGPRLRFREGWQPTLRAAIPEADLLHASIGVDTLAVLSPRPDVIQPLLRGVARLVPPWPWFRRLYLGGVGLGVTVLRRSLFQVPTPVVIAALAGREGDRESGLWRTLTTPDGVSCGAYATAAAAAALLASRPPPGVYCSDELLTLDGLVAGVAALPGAPSIELEHGGCSAAPAE
jgi:hypothetical protein